MMIELRVGGEVVWSGTKWWLLVQFIRGWKSATAVTKKLPKTEWQVLQEA